MLIISLIILILSYSITLRRDKSILYSRATITILVIASLISYDNLNFLFLNKGIGIFGGLFHATYVTSIFQIFIMLISATILLLISFYPRKVLLKENSFTLLNKKTYLSSALFKRFLLGLKIAILLILIYFIHYLGLDFFFKFCVGSSSTNTYYYIMNGYPQE